MVSGESRIFTGWLRASKLDYCFKLFLGKSGQLTWEV